MLYVPCGWLFSSVWTERITESLSICWAMRGKSSEIWMPGTLVAIGLRLLFPLGSQVSIWLGPPSSQSRMHAWALPRGGVALPARARRGLEELSQANAQRAERPHPQESAPADGGRLGWPVRLDLSMTASVSGCRRTRAN